MYNASNTIRAKLAYSVQEVPTATPALSEESWNAAATRPDAVVEYSAQPPVIDTYILSQRIAAVATGSEAQEAWDAQDRLNAARDEVAAAHQAHPQDYTGGES